MQYEVKKIEYVNKPQAKDANTLIQYANVTMGIVGNSYEGFTQTDTYIAEFPTTGMDISQLETFIDSNLTEQAHKKYPNT